MLNYLPNSVRVIAEVIGLESTMNLLNQLPVTVSPGQRKRHVLMLYVPKRLSPEHELVRMIGYRDATKLVRAFGGEILYPANCRNVFRRIRDESVIRAVNLGARVEIVAELYGMTVRNVRSILDAEKAPEENTPDDRQHQARL